RSVGPLDEDHADRLALARLLHAVAHLLGALVDGLLLGLDDPLALLLQPSPLLGREPLLLRGPLALVPAVELREPAGPEARVVVAADERLVAGGRRQEAH